MTAARRTAPPARPVAWAAPLVLLGTVLALALLGSSDVAGRAVGAHLVAFRMPVTLGLALLAALVLAVPRARRSRPGRAAAGVLLLGAALQLGVLASRGWDGDVPRSRVDGDVVVLAFNTLGVVPSDELAPLVLAHDADLAVLTETEPRTAEATAALLTDAGRPTTALVRRTGDDAVSSTALLVSDHLGRYEITGTLPTMLAGFRAAPTTGAGERPAGPVVVAAHPMAPVSRAAMPQWRTETARVRDACAGEPGVVVAGDLNATLDHPALRDLGPCRDAAQEAGAAALGTWPASLPSWLATPIDHVLVDDAAWEVVGFDVLGAVGRSDHRPVVAHLRPR